jgi:hypothetical protein
MKTCLKCNILKENTEFYNHFNVCKKCEIQRSREYKKAHPEKIKEYKKRYAQKHKEQIRAYRLKNKDRRKYRYSSLDKRFLKWQSGAKYRNIGWEITLGDINRIPMICHYTKIPLVLELGKYNTISLDRLDSSKGYTKDNVVFCCSAINKMKMDLEFKQFIEFCNLVSENSKSLLPTSGL